MVHQTACPAWMPHSMAFCEKFRKTDYGTVMGSSLQIVNDEIFASIFGDLEICIVTHKQVCSVTILHRYHGYHHYTYTECDQWRRVHNRNFYKLALISARKYIVLVYLG